MSERDDNKAANAHATELLGDSEEQEAFLRSLGVLPPEPESGPDNPFDGGPREPAPPMPTKEGVEEAHNQDIVEFAARLRQEERGA